MAEGKRSMALNISVHTLKTSPCSHFISQAMLVGKEKKILLSQGGRK